VTDQTENHNAPFITVGELSGAIKRTLEGAFDYVRVRGEISRPSFPGSGHVYFTLKDDTHNLGAVIWKGVAASLDVRPEEGLEVIATGKVTSFSGQSKYQLNVRSLEIAGEGALLKLLEERRRTLEKEGLFAVERKQPLPTFPKVIGIVTSPTGAVIQDILHRLRERFGCHVLVWPVLVQGQGAAGQVAAAIDGFNALSGQDGVARPDLLIVARGGGSLEDLMAFNEEEVVRAAARSQIPLISSIGHETDTTLLDFVADRRAPTPTAAAEMATPVKSELQAKLTEWGMRQSSAVERRLEQAANLLRTAERGLLHPVEKLNAQGQALDYAHNRLVRLTEAKLLRQEAALSQMAGRLIPPAQQLAKMAGRFEVASNRLQSAASARLEAQTARLATASRLLEASSFTKVLARGFALIRDKDGKAVRSIASLSAGTQVSLRLVDGQTEAQILGGTGEPPKKPKDSKAKKEAKPATRQSDLFG